jgi:hypothetical protein
VEWKHEKLAGIIGENRSFNHEGGDDGTNPANEATQRS